MTDYKVIPDNIYPARGRKPCKTFAIQIALALHSRQYLPRKGTETIAAMICGLVILF